MVKNHNSQDSEDIYASSCEEVEDSINNNIDNDITPSSLTKTINTKLSSIITPKVYSFVRRIIKPKCTNQSIKILSASLNNDNNFSIIPNFDGFEYIAKNDEDFPGIPLLNNIKIELPKIDEKCLTITPTILGSGAFCIVHKGYLYDANKEETKTVAFKEVINRLRNPDEIMNEVMNEGEILFQMNHMNIIKLYGIYGTMNDIRDHKKVGLVLECCRGGSLGNLIHNLKFKDTYILLCLMKQIGNGCDYLHQSYSNRYYFDNTVKRMYDNISLSSSNLPVINDHSYDDEGVFLHGDLKCENILVKEKICLHSIEKYNNDTLMEKNCLNSNPVICGICGGTLVENLTLKIVDFGLSKSEKEVSNKIQGTVAYMAPEIFRSGIYTKKSDVYSYGVVLWEVFSGKKPYLENEGLVDIIKDVTEDVINYYEKESSLTESFSSNYDVSHINFSKVPGTVLLQDLILRCLSYDLEIRPSFKGIIKSIEDHIKKLTHNKVKNSKHEDIVAAFVEKDKRIEILEQALELSKRNNNSGYNTFPRRSTKVSKVLEENSSKLFQTYASDEKLCEPASKYISIHSLNDNTSHGELLRNNEYISISNKNNN
uniref:Protein kinase domain-containing protein n=1 Tax=Parastrongyloides trichosuri TaxID=131310 RepID=A0A0N4Z8Y1_PARTI